MRWEFFLSTGIGANKEGGNFHVGVGMQPKAPTMDIFLQYIRENKDTLAIIIPAVSASCFLVSVFFAFITLIRARSLQKENTARNIFNDYLKLAMQNPMFAYPPRFKSEYNFENRTMGKGDDGAKHFEEYEWFVSFLVFSMKEILDIFRRDKYWKATAKRQLEYQIEYLVWRKSQKDPNFVKLAGKRVNRMIDKIAKDGGYNVEPTPVWWRRIVLLIRKDDTL